MKRLFYNGSILTMDNKTIDQAMLIENGIILKTGSEKDLMGLSDTAEKIDLEGKTLMPAFIDAHSHLSSYANSFLQVSLETADSFDNIIERLREYQKENNIKSGEWLIANGYDHNHLKERTHPTKELLDEFFPHLNVVLQHQSGHFGVFNSAALKTLGLNDVDDHGYLEESSYVDTIKKLPLPEPEKLISAYQKAQKRYASYGISTIQEGMMVSEMLPLYQMLLKSNILMLDVIGYTQIKDAQKFYDTFPLCATGYDRGFRLGGYKIFLDGSPQGKTAWMKKPYVGTNNFGVSTMTDEEVQNALTLAVVNRRQIIAHCNGDAAAQQLLSCADNIENKTDLARLRPVIIHAQLLEKNQLPLVKKLGFIPSFFVAHCYYWGDVHIQNFGFDRAKEISPAKDALDMGICFTFHQDTPVIEPDMLQTVWTAVNRVTKSGVFLGEQERISVYDALLAVTRNAAYQYGEEDIKGTLMEGKYADFVVLDKNPLEVEKDSIKDIMVLQTYKHGECIYNR